MSRMVRSVCALAVAAAAFGFVASYEVTWEGSPAHSTVANPGEVTWESTPADVVAAPPGEVTWESIPANAKLSQPGEVTWEIAPAHVGSAGA
ncbi:hypothetical protein [Streptomyces sp. NBC_01014]|uniref:hypothetical protein n=1 Tax=Streptomyces sp. NBC_01014 TaxID=2903719 RepID=UPI00386C6789|nr:hypothetical protein OG282_17190 [Streptomyces sp. NBC_01014]